MQLKFAAGLHKKVPAPAAFSVVLSPMQMDTSEPALTAGKGSAVREIRSVSVHVLSVTIKVYVVEVVGLATGLEIFGLLKFPDGDQL